MSLHYGHVRTAPGGFQAYCQCGWEGLVREARATADNDARRHELHERGPGSYA